MQRLTEVVKVFPGFNKEVKFYKRITREGGAIETASPELCPGTPVVRPAVNVSRTLYSYETPENGTCPPHCLRVFRKASQTRN